METVIVACNTLEQELMRAIENTGVSYPIYWVESGLHNYPQKLNATMQGVIDKISADRVLVSMGFCGNSIAGVQVRDFEFIVPRVDDCISLLIGSVNKRIETGRELSAYFLTEGWLRGERNLWVEHQYAVEKYGEEQAESIAEMMYGHYRSLALLDSGVDNMEQLLDKTKIISDTLKLKQEVVPASVTYLEKLLTGPWNSDEFLIKRPGETIESSDLALS